MTRRVFAIVPVLLVLAACNTILSESRVLPEATVTVSWSGVPNGLPTGPNTEPCMPDADVVVYVDGEQVATGTSDETGDFDIPITAPADPDTYEVQATCTGLTPDPEDADDATTTVTLNPAALLVETVVSMSADPEAVEPGATFEVTGSFCVSDTGSTVPPEADITFEGDTQTATASSPQPFEETWTLTFTAPPTPGTYEVTGLCTFEDLTTTPPTITLPDEVAPASIEPGPGGEVGERAYDPIEITVAAPTTSTSTSTTTTTVATAPRAEASAAAPTFTG